MHNSESDLNNETYKILWGYEIQTDHLISARRPEMLSVNFTDPFNKAEKGL